MACCGSRPKRDGNEGVPPTPTPTSSPFKNGPDPSRRTAGPVLNAQHVVDGKTALLIIDVQPLCQPVSPVWGAGWGPEEHREFYAKAFPNVLSNVQSLLELARETKNIEIVHTTIVRCSPHFPLCALHPGQRRVRLLRRRRLLTTAVT